MCIKVWIANYDDTLIIIISSFSEYQYSMHIMEVYSDTIVRLLSNGENCIFGIRESWWAGWVSVQYCLWPGISVTQSVTPVTGVTQAAKSRDIVTDASSPSGDHHYVIRSSSLCSSHLGSFWFVLGCLLRIIPNYRDDKTEGGMILKDVTTRIWSSLFPRLSAGDKSPIVPHITNLLSHIWSPGHRETLSVEGSSHL